MSTPEPDQPETSVSRSRGSWTNLIVVTLLLLYALSVAPVMKLSGGKPSAAMSAFYAPLEFLYDNIPAVEKFYDWYLKIWGIE